MPLTDIIVQQIHAVNILYSANFLTRKLLANMVNFPIQNSLMIYCIEENFGGGKLW